MTKRKILVIGETCLDAFQYGTCTRLNPEAPTPVFVSKTVVTNPGMAGNVAKNLESLTAFDVGQILSPEGMISKHRFVDETSNYIMLRVDNDGPVPGISLNDEVMESIRSADAVVVSDYDKGFLNPMSLEIIAGNAQLSFLDTKKPLGFWANEFDWIKINHKEFKNPLHNASFIEKNRDRIIVTLGGDGCMIGETLFQGYDVQVRDVVGAGDSFLAAWAAAYLWTGDVKRSALYANWAASRVVKVKGVYDLRDNKGKLKEMPQIDWPRKQIEEL